MKPVAAENLWYGLASMFVLNLMITYNVGSRAKGRLPWADWARMILLGLPWAIYLHVREHLHGPAECVFVSHSESGTPCLPYVCRSREEAVRRFAKEEDLRPGDKVYTFLTESTEVSARISGMLDALVDEAYDESEDFGSSIQDALRKLPPGALGELCAEVNEVLSKWAHKHKVPLSMDLLGKREEHSVPSSRRKRANGS